MLAILQPVSKQFIFNMYFTFNKILALVLYATMRKCSGTCSSALGKTVGSMGDRAGNYTHKGI